MAKEQSSRNTLLFLSECGRGVDILSLFRCLNAALFFQHFPLNSRPAKLKKFAKLKDFLLNSSTILS